MKKATLADKVINFSKIKLKKTAVKVPRLRIKRENVRQKKDDSMPVSSIINILIKASVENAKKERKENNLEEDKSYTILKEDRKLIFNGGYGTVSKDYGTAPHTSYVDYEKLFSYLGKFRAKSPYENMANHVEVLNKATESGSFVLADRNAMNKIGWFDKYKKSPVMDMPIMALSLVPIAGLSSGEWEEIKMLMKFDPVIYNLKTKTS